VCDSSKFFNREITKSEAPKINPEEFTKIIIIPYTGPTEIPKKKNCPKKSF
jgi:hypothetical protein